MDADASLEAQRAAGATSVRAGAALSQTTSTPTRSACAASASMSARSPVRTVPPGSAIATTSASTAEPLRASLRSSAALRATSTLTLDSMMHVFRKRLVLAHECVTVRFEITRRADPAVRGMVVLAVIEALDGATTTVGAWPARRASTTPIDGQGAVWSLPHGLVDRPTSRGRLGFSRWPGGIARDVQDATVSSRYISTAAASRSRWIDPPPAPIQYSTWRFTDAAALSDVIRKSERNPTVGFPSAAA